MIVEPSHSDRVVNATVDQYLLPPTMGEECDCFFNIRLGHMACVSQRSVSGSDMRYLQGAVVTVRG